MPCGLTRCSRWRTPRIPILKSQRHHLIVIRRQKLVNPQVIPISRSLHRNRIYNHPPIDIMLQQPPPKPIRVQQHKHGRLLQTRNRMPQISFQPLRRNSLVHAKIPRYQIGILAQKIRLTKPVREGRYATDGRVSTYQIDSQRMKRFGEYAFHHERKGLVEVISTSGRYGITPERHHEGCREGDCSKDAFGRVLYSAVILPFLLVFGGGEGDYALGEHWYGVRFATVTRCKFRTDGFAAFEVGGVLGSVDSVRRIIFILLRDSLLRYSLLR
mmetsp:Transcript_38887/g.57218  ORF Transcript_38887/g.57218 Transcript_38887/m.57218 type:complete len:271 (-) Transcript_38887:309-1121(-)